MSMPGTTHPDIYSRKDRLVKSVPEAQTDISKIIKRFEETGQLPVNPNQAVYADVTPYAKGLLEAKLHLEKMKKDLVEQINTIRELKKDADKASEKKPTPELAPVPEKKSDDKSGNAPK